MIALIVKKYWLLIFGIISLLFCFRFVFTHSFSTGTVKVVAVDKLLFMKNTVTVIDFVKDGTHIIARYYGGSGYKTGDVVQLIYLDKHIQYHKSDSSHMGMLYGSTPLPVIYDTPLMIGDASVWAYNLFCWLILMAVVVGIKRLRNTKLKKSETQ